MKKDICLNCFKDKNNFSVCPHCGYVEGTPPEQDYYLTPGTILNGRYLVGVVLGFGGFGVTYKAWDLKLNSVVAIKEFYPAGLVNRVPGEKEIQIFDGTEKENYKEYLERFLDEAKNLAQFNGRANIVNVFSFFEENGTAYIVMEFLDGISLKAYVEEYGKMPVDTALVIINDLLNGVGEVHQKGILHRDIAPDNIILTNEGAVKILDFGSARFSSDNNEKTLSAFIKPGYAAPEQYAAQGEQGVWTDIYGLGATMYYMVTGIKPEESTDRMVSDTVQRPTDLGIELPVEVDKSIMKAMALQIEMRFKNTDEFLAAVSGEYAIEYPDVEIKKRKFKRNIFAGLSAATLVFAIGLSVFLYNYLEVDPYEQIEPCTLDMWVYLDNKEYEAGKSNLPEDFKALITDYKENGEYAAKVQAYKDLAANYKEYITKEYPNAEIDVNVLVFNDENGYNVELKKAYESGDMPDIFMASSIFNEVADSAMVVEDMADIYLSGRVDFINENNYAEFYPSQKLLPLSFKAPVVYGNNALIQDYNMDSTKNSFDSVDDFIALDNNLEEQGRSCITRASRGKAVEKKIWAISDEGFNGFTALYGTQLKDSDSLSNNKELLSTIKTSFNNNNFNTSTPLDDYFHYNQLAYYVGDTSEFEYVNNYMGGNFSVFPMSNNGEHIVYMETEMALNKDLDENKTLAARSFMEYLLTEDGQAFINVIIGEALPINTSQMSEYREKINTQFDILEDYTNATVIGESKYSEELIANDVYQSCYIGSEDIGQIEISSQSVTTN